MVIDNRPTDEATESVLAPRLQQELLAHEGKWVAITKTELLAVGDSPDEVLHGAAERGVKQPILYFVPRDGHSSMFF
jgi:Family of unknown function (DUF5678)